MPGKFPSVIKNVSVTTAAHGHNCRRDDTHRIAKGDTRLEIKVDRDTHRYCVACARRSLETDKDKLQQLLDRLD